MAKKLKKKDIPPEVRFKRRLKKYFRRLLVAAAAAAFYFFVIPVLVPSLAPQINSQKNFLENLGAGTGQEMTNVLSALFGQLDRFIAGESGAIEHNTEAVIKNAVSDLKQRVKSLPGEQLDKVKREFCADLSVSPEASLAATPSGQGENGE